MKFNDIVYSATLGEIIIRFAQKNPQFLDDFMKGGITGSIDLELAPASMNFRRADIQEAIATLRVLGKL